MTVLEIVADVSRRLSAAEIPHAIGGSLASSLWGDARNTNDADIGIRLAGDQQEALATAFPDPYLISRLDLESAMDSQAEYRTIQELHLDEAFKIDLFLVREDAYTESEFSRIRWIETGSAGRLPYLASENIAIQKFRWFREGNEVSDRQWNDIVRLLEVQRPTFDRAYLDQWAIHFGLEGLVERAFAQLRA